MIILNYLGELIPLIQVLKSRVLFPDCGQRKIRLRKNSPWNATLLALKMEERGHLSRKVNDLKTLEKSMKQIFP